MSEEKIKKDAKIAWGNFTKARSAQASVNEEKIFLELFRMALKSQDRDTRHACAEAVEGAALKEAPEICKTQAACAACVNVQAV